MTIFKKEIIQWGYESLSSQGYTLKSKLPEEVITTPWSYVARFVTSDGYIYLKHTPELLALEPAIIQILHDQFHSPVPEIIANNTELHCFLMKDAGHPLRKILKKQFDVNLLCNAIDQYTSMQVAVADHVNIFLDIGVPDWRLDKLPDLYKQLLSQKDVLMADGLLDWELNELENFHSKVVYLCKKLSAYPIKQTIDSCEFQDNNTLIDNKKQKLTLGDLGESVISHPFFSLITCLRLAKFHYALDEQDEDYAALMNACFKNYLLFDSQKNLLDAFTLARILCFIYEALAQYRLRMAVSPAGFMLLKWHGQLCGILREFMTRLAKHFYLNEKITDSDLEDSIELVEYNLDWPKMAYDEIEFLKKLLPSQHILDIQHVGSTAIPGMIAKPIIDIQIAVDSLIAAKQFAINILEANGYVYWYDNPDPERMFFVKGMPPYGEKRTHHVHMYEPSCPQWRNKIYFRDYLIKHPETARQYAEIKKELAKKHTYDREAYTDAKTEFVNNILNLHHSEAES